MSVNHEIKEQEGLLSITFSSTLHIFVRSVTRGEMSATSHHELIPKKDTLPSVQGCVLPVKSYLFGSILLETKRTKS